MPEIRGAVAARAAVLVWLAGAIGVVVAIHRGGAPAAIFVVAYVAMLAGAAWSRLVTRRAR